MAGTDPTAGHRRRTSYFTGCMSPSCIPVPEDYYTRIHHDSQLPPPIGGVINTPRRRWQAIIKKLVRESKCIYGSTKPPPMTFRYDAVSYSQNFDEGCHREEQLMISRFVNSPQVISVREVRLSTVKFSKV